TMRPRTWYVEGQVNPADVINNEVGAPIRTRAPGMVGEFTRTFLGQQAMPVLDWLDNLSSRRTGVTAASQGLDPDALQSTTKAAVTATVSAAQARSELIARIFAETFAKRLFTLIRNLVIRHQDRARSIQLNGAWIDVDPRVWDADLDFHVNTGLGRGSVQDEINNLSLIATKQEQIMQVLGPANPFAGIDKYRNALARIANKMGFRDDSQFFGQVDPQMIQQAMQGNQKPDPNMIVAQAEQMKAQTAAQESQGKMEIEKQVAVWKHEEAMEKIKVDAMV